MKKRLWILLGLFMILVTGTCAWMLSIERPDSRFIDVTYESLQIASEDIRLKVMKKASDGTLVEITDPEGLTVEDVVPNDMIEFTLRIYNGTGILQKASIYFDGMESFIGEEYEAAIDEMASLKLADRIVTDPKEEDYKAYKDQLKEYFLGFMFAGSLKAKGTGYDELLAARPASCYVHLEEISEKNSGGTYSCCFFKNIEIPPSSNEGDWIDIPCYFLLDRSCDSTCMDMGFKVSKIRLVI